MISILEQVENTACGDHKDQTAAKGQPDDFPGFFLKIPEAEQGKDKGNPQGTYPEEIDKEAGHMGTYQPEQIINRIRYTCKIVPHTGISRMIGEEADSRQNNEKKKKNAV